MQFRSNKKDVHKSRRTCCVKSRYAGVDKRLEVLYSCCARCPIAVSLASAKPAPHLQIQHLHGDVHRARMCSQVLLCFCFSTKSTNNCSTGNALMTA